MDLRPLVVRVLVRRARKGMIKFDSLVLGNDSTILVYCWAAGYGVIVRCTTSEGSGQLAQWGSMGIYSSYVASFAKLHKALTDSIFVTLARPT